jgi:hypothetical protein
MPSRIYLQLKSDWKLLIVVPLCVGLVMIGLGGPAKPVVFGCLLGILARTVINSFSSL